MAPSYILSIDQGTTSSRALLFDKDGQPVAKDQVELEQHYPQPGWAEHDPKRILEDCVKCCQSVMAQAKATAADIAGIGITNQRETTVVWDKATGEPFYKAIVWLDARTSDTVSQLSKGQGGKERFRKKTGLPLSTYFSAVKMKWLLDNVPEVKKAAEEKRCMFGTIESWIIYNLTGGKDGGIHITDLSNASRYMLMDIKKCQWDEGICKSLGIPMESLPAIKSNSEVYGKVKGFGILDGIPISGSLGDQHAALLGQGCLEVGSSKNTYGTGCFMLLNTGLEAVPSHSGLLTTIGFKLGPDAKTHFALEGSVACAGRTVQWLRDNMGIIRAAEEVEGLATAVPDTGGVTMVPAFSGLFAPYWREDARAVIVGMTLYTRREHYCRAALEAVAFSTVDVMEAMKLDTGLRLGNMHVDGGMTANNFLMQLQADLLGVEVLRAKMPEATVLGAAFAAGMAVGFYEKITDIKDILKKAGGWESFPCKLKPADRKKEYARWKDAVERAYNLQKWDPQEKQPEAPLKKPKFQKVSSIKPEQRNLNLFLKIIKIPEVNGESLHDVVCGDATGIVTLRLRPDHFLPCEVGGYIRVQNARVAMSKGFIKIMVDKWGKVSQEDDPGEPIEVKMDNDISSVEYTLK